MSRLDHPNIVKVYGITRGPLRLILEYCTRGTLLETLKKNPGLNWEAKKRLLLDIAKCVSS